MAAACDPLLEALRRRAAQEGERWLQALISGVRAPLPVLPPDPLPMARPQAQLTPPALFLQQAAAPGYSTASPGNPSSARTTVPREHGGRRTLRHTRPPEQLRVTGEALQSRGHNTALHVGQPPRSARRPAKKSRARENVTAHSMPQPCVQAPPPSRHHFRAPPTPLHQLSDVRGPVCSAPSASSEAMRPGHRALGTKSRLTHEQALPLQYRAPSIVPAHHLAPNQINGVNHIISSRVPPQTLHKGVLPTHTSHNTANVPLTIPTVAPNTPHSHRGHRRRRHRSSTSSSHNSHRHSHCPLNRRSSNRYHRRSSHRSRHRSVSPDKQNRRQLSRDTSVGLQAGAGVPVILGAAPPAITPAGAGVPPILGAAPPAITPAGAGVPSLQKDALPAITQAGARVPPVWGGAPPTITPAGAGVPPLPGNAPPASNGVPVICLSNLWKYCNLGNDCPDMHYYLPYRWQIYKGTDWEDLPKMEEIEKCYCDPKVDRVPLIDFLTMRSAGHRVRRLSTESSVVMPSEYVLTTEWLWYWRDENGTWTQYGHSDVNHVIVTISPSDLELRYLYKPNDVIPFVAGKNTYEINCQDMKQKNVLYKTERDVRRRPKYLSFDDVKSLKGSTKSAAIKSPLKLGTSPLNSNTYPKTWDPAAMPEIGCQKVLLSDTSNEVLSVVHLFSKTVSGHEVKKMWRLQNPSLWQVFQWQKEHMKKVNQGRDVREMRLFHGTDIMHIDAICDHNFDWRICGTHGTSFGQGSYFTRIPSYAHKFSIPAPSGTRVMFIARVLVGDYVTGNPQMKRPPPRPGSTSRYYDSCVNNTINPFIFVVFEKHQIYPEYLLEYEEQKKS